MKPLNPQTRLQCELALSKLARTEEELAAIARADDHVESRRVYRAAANALGRLRKAYGRKWSVDTTVSEANAPAATGAQEGGAA